MRTHSVTGGAGVRLHVREWGNDAAPPILFIHGWSQNHLCWRSQYESPLAEHFRLVAFDLRGHGMSEMPTAPKPYTEAQHWADDVAAVIAQLELRHPVVVASSYGGFVVCDYLRAFGAGDIAGVNFVGALVTLNKSAFGTLIGPGFLDYVVGATSDDLPTNIETIRSFVRGCTHSPLPSEQFEAALCWNMAVPASVRAALVAREIDSEEVLTTLDRPVLVTHGRDDKVILPEMGRQIHAACPSAAASWYPETGHFPFLENPDRFNGELSRFAQEARGAVPGPDQTAGVP